MADNIEEVRELLNGDWKIRRRRTGREFPPNNKLVQVQHGQKMREYYLSQDDYRELMDEVNERWEKRHEHLPDHDG